MAASFATSFSKNGGMRNSSGPSREPLLFRIPPFLEKDVAKLATVLAALPPAQRVALEFLHESWFDEEVYALLRARDVAICLSDTDEVAALMVSTASWGYLRLRRTKYTPRMLAAWRARIEAQPWQEAFVFFKHEDEGKGPKFAREFGRVSSRA